jgi:hypothetical protein
MSRQTISPEICLEVENDLRKLRDQLHSILKRVAPYTTIPTQEKIVKVDNKIVALRLMFEDLRLRQTTR